MGTISRSTVGDGVSQDLRWLEAVGVSWSCRMTRFRRFADLPVDGRWDSESLPLIRAVTLQIMGRQLDEVPASIVSWLRSAAGSDVDSLVRRCRSVEPAPPEPTDPTAEEPEPEPEPEPTTGAAVMSIVTLSQESRQRTQKRVDAAKWHQETFVSPNYGHMEIRLARNPEDRDESDILHVFDDVPDGQGYGGFHTVDNMFRPVAFTYTQTGLDPTVVLTHECSETNPGTNAWVNKWVDHARGSLWHEIADAVQSITITAPNGEETTDIVLPHWWGRGQQRSSRLLHAAATVGNPVLTYQGQIAPGGYMGRRTNGSIDFIWGATQSAASLPAGIMQGFGCELRAVKRRIMTACDGV